MEQTATSSSKDHNFNTSTPSKLHLWISTIRESIRSPYIPLYKKANLPKLGRANPIHLGTCLLYQLRGDSVGRGVGLTLSDDSRCKDRCHLKALPPPEKEKQNFETPMSKHPPPKNEGPPVASNIYNYKRPFWAKKKNRAPTKSGVTVASGKSTLAAFIICRAQKDGDRLLLSWELVMSRSKD